MCFANALLNGCVYVGNVLVESTVYRCIGAPALLRLLGTLGDVVQRVVLHARRAVAATHPVAPGKVLAVVDVEVEVVQRVMRGPVDDLFQWRVADHVAVVDQDGPAVDKDKQANVDESVQREQKDKDVVRQRLRIPVHRVERVRRKRCGHQPLVVRLVDVLVQSRVVLEPVHPVDAKVGKEQEEGHAEHGVDNAVVGDVGVELRVPPNLGDEPRQRHQVQGRKCP